MLNSRIGDYSENDLCYFCTKKYLVVKPWQYEDNLPFLHQNISFGLEKGSPLFENSLVHVIIL